MLNFDGVFKAILFIASIPLTFVMCLFWLKPASATDWLQWVGVSILLLGSFYLSIILLLASIRYLKAANKRRKKKIDFNQ